MSKHSETERAYLAGFFDGEGMVTIFAQPTYQGRSHILLAAVSNTDLAALTTIQARWGGRLRTIKPAKDNWKEVHRLDWTWQAAAVLLREIRPYLVVKARHADLGISLAERKQTTTRVSISREEWDAREDLRLALRAINTQRGTSKFPDRIPYPVIEQEIACARCASIFLSDRKTSRFCSHKCYQAEYYRAHKK